MFASDLYHPNETLQDKLKTLYHLKPGPKVALGFREPYLNLLKAFGNPHLTLPPVIHVAGTNGKGSTVAMLRAILEAADYTVHVYTSPHLVKFNERIVLAGEMIADNQLEPLIDEALHHNKGAPITFKEITNAMAFAAFSRTPADIVLLEVGLGGRLDTTNVIERPLVSIIGPIGYDHMEYLGTSLSAIAAEKAGIMKRRVPCVIGMQSGPLKNENDTKKILSTFEKLGKMSDTALFRYGEEWFIEDHDPKMTFHFVDKMRQASKPNLPGAHQIYNAGMALAALQLIARDFPVKEEAVAKGLQNIRWPGRLQRLPALAFGLPEEWELWLDGGHNEEAACALAQSLDRWQRDRPMPVDIIVGMMGHKDLKTFLKPFLPHIDTIQFCAIASEEDCMKHSDIKSALHDAPLSCVPHFYPDYAKALKAVAERCKEEVKPRRILITGSLYLAGHILKDADKSAHNDV